MKKKEILIIEFMPSKLTDKELLSIIDETIKEVGADSLRDFSTKLFL